MHFTKLKLRSRQLASMALPPLLLALPALAQTEQAPLNLRMPVQPPSQARPADSRPGGVANRLRFTPRQGILEQGIEASYEAVAQCQKGPYPGATLAAYHVIPIGGNAQPDHCYRY
ncbi:hypothetical protein [Paucibacter soli]|uniref:hypothetical protein n=1 Tax=Paucibacter soli TaxID=3133433 RepID=UPI0030ACF020